MKANFLRKRGRQIAVPTLLAVISIAGLLGVRSAYADDDNDSPFPLQGHLFIPGNLVVSRSVYVNTNSITAGKTVLPPNCSLTNCPTSVTAVADGTYPYVFNNDTVDGSFGITSQVFLDQVTPFGWVFSSLECPTACSTESGLTAIKWSLVSPQNRN